MNLEIRMRRKRFPIHWIQFFISDHWDIFGVNRQVSKQVWISNISSNLSRNKNKYFTLKQKCWGIKQETEE